ncbi:MAG TPA: glycoside hydrolase family 13 protein [Anaerolineae bacterium]|nr:glycoside hydrolase family 13 protein [Anaerolineae bacterium]
MLTSQEMPVAAPVTPEWVKDAIFYQIFPDRFARSGRVGDRLHLEAWDSPPTPFGFKGGDLYGVAERLDYLQDLGVTAIYLNPIFASAANHRYHPYDYLNVDPILGGNAALRELIDAAHARNIRIVLDGVFNHASRGFWPFHHTLENGAASPYVDWFHFDPDRLHGHRHFAAYPDPEAAAALRSGTGSLKAIGYQAWWDLPALPKFNTSTPAVREFLWNVATHWIEFGIDGWRLDVPAEIDDDDFWREFRRRVKSANPEAYIVGEIWHEAQRWLQGDQFDAVMNYPVTMASLGFYGGERLNLAETRRPTGYHDLRPLDATEFADRIDWILSLYDPAITQVQLNLLDSHDTPRFITSVNGYRSALRLALLFLFTYPGAPCVYYGDEIGLDGQHDPDNRKTFPWDESDWDHDLRAFVKRCVALRKAHPALRRGSVHRLHAQDGVYAFGRQLEGETLLIALNTASAMRTLSLPVGSLGFVDASLADAWTGSRYIIADGTLRDLKLAPRSGVVLK